MYRLQQSEQWQHVSHFISTMTRLPLPLLLLTSLLLLLSCCTPHCESTPLPTSVSVDTATGAYNVTLNGKPWLSSAPSRFYLNHGWETPGSPSSSSRISGADATGTYTGVMLEYDDVRGVRVQASFRNYGGDAEHVVVFEVAFPDGANGTALPLPVPEAGGGVSTTFPSFLVEGASSLDRGYMCFEGQFIANTHIGQFWEGTADIGTGEGNSGPMVVFERGMGASSVISSFSNFMTASTGFDTDSRAVSYGILGSVTQYPPGYSMATIIVGGTGINDAMMEWGDVLLNAYGKTRDAAYFDPTVSTLQYNTDHGSYYYYQHPGYASYEDMLVNGVKAYAAQEGIPYRAVLLDSWWYFQGPFEGVTEWVAKPGVFPSGMDNMVNTLEWSVTAHNRYWSYETVYATQNGGEYPFIVEKSLFKAIPTSETFWNDLMENSTWLHGGTYLQDWLFNEFEGLDATQQSPTLARQWLMEMGSAALQHGIHIQYCMPWPRHVMQSVEIPAVDQVRAAPDQVPGSHDAFQWRAFGTSSMFSWALGLIPLKDNFESTVDQPGTSSKKKESFPRLEAAVATFTGGTVSIGDGVGYSNATLIMRSSRTDGIILKPSRPMTALDSTVAAGAWPDDGCDGLVWSSESLVGSDFASAHLLAALVTSPCKVAISELGPSSAPSYVVWESNTTTTLQTLSPSDQIPIPADAPLGGWGFSLFHVVPTLGSTGWAFLGEQSKWVPTSHNRYTNIAYSSQDITVSVVGASSEVVVSSFASPQGVVHVAPCTLPPSGSVTLSFSLDTQSFKCLPM